MKRIFKYTLVPGERNAFFLSEDAYILHVAEQNGSPCVWVATDPDGEQKEVDFIILGTGYGFDENEVVLHGVAMCGPFVWHVGVKI